LGVLLGTRGAVVGGVGPAGRGGLGLGGPLRLPEGLVAVGLGQLRGQAGAALGGQLVLGAPAPPSRS